MSLLRIIQKSGSIRENSLFSYKSHDYDIEQLRQIVKEKDVIIENNNEKIQELENHVTELQEQCSAMYHQTSFTETSEKRETLQISSKNPQLFNILKNYEKFISEITANYEIMKEERDVASTHLAKLEFGFADLVEKYERLKKVVIGYQQNQQVLLKHIEEYRNATEILEKRYDDLKVYANTKLQESNLHLEKNDKKHISEMAKVKAQLLHSKVRINDLEKKIALLTSNNSIGDGPSLEDMSSATAFTPLSKLL